MGISGMSITSLLIILLLVVLLFGTKKLRNMGGDLGGAFRNFKRSLHEEDNHSTITDQQIVDQAEDEQTKTEPMKRKES